jgi:hypothetical protein
MTGGNTGMTSRERILLGLGMCWISALATRALTASTPQCRYRPTRAWSPPSNGYPVPCPALIQICPAANHS